MPRFHFNYGPNPTENLYSDSEIVIATALVTLLRFRFLHAPTPRYGVFFPCIIHDEQYAENYLNRRFECIYVEAEHVKFAEDWLQSLVGEETQWL